MNPCVSVSGSIGRESNIGLDIMSIENRKLRRYRSLKGAQLVDCATGSYSECTVLDLHSRGARVRLRRMPQTLGNVELLLLPEQIKVPAVARWLRGTQVGLEFGRSIKFLEKHDMSPEGKPVNPAENTPIA